MIELRMTCFVPNTIKIENKQNLYVSFFKRLNA